MYSFCIPTRETTVETTDSLPVDKKGQQTIIAPKRNFIPYSFLLNAY